jgi:hypothetical protein
MFLLSHNFYFYSFTAALNVMDVVIIYIYVNWISSPDPKKKK